MLKFRPQNQANKQNIHIRVKKTNRTVEPPGATTPHKRPPQRRIQGSVPGGAPPRLPLFLYQTEAQHAEKNLGGTPGVPLLSQSLDDPPPPPRISQGLDPALHVSKISKLFPVKLLQVEPFVNDHIS